MLRYFKIIGWVFFIIAGCGKSSPNPTIASFTPAAALVGATITITGTNFDSIPGNNMVTFFDDVPAVITSCTSTQIVTTVPQGATTGAITVATTNGAQNVPSETSFTVLPPPTISSFTPVSALPGATVTITGTNFDPIQANNVVTFSDGIPAVITSSSSTQIVTTVPSGATTGEIIVTVDGLSSVASGTSFVTP
jgi:hypothetical protein